MNIFPNKGSRFYYIAGGLLFIVFLFAFDRGLFHLIRSMEKNLYGKKDLSGIFFQKRDFNKQFLKLPKGTYNTLIMGSSRTHRGIHPFYIHKRLKQKAFKIAKAKIRLKFNYYFYNEYKKIAGVPKVVIYGLDYFMFKLESHPFFMQFVAPTEQNVRKYDQGPLLLVSNKAQVNDFVNNALEQWNRNITEDVEESNVGNQASDVVDPFKGYGKKESIPSQRPPRFKRFKYEGYPGVEGQYFIRLLDQWREDDVQVVLVYLPDYIGTYLSNYQLDDFKAEIQKLTSGYDNITIYDYNRPEKFSLHNTAYFLDGGYGKTNSHLSIAGSRVFHRSFLKSLRKHYK
jgi:hypothetical protein